MRWERCQTDVFRERASKRNDRWMRISSNVEPNEDWIQCRFHNVRTKEDDRLRSKGHSSYSCSYVYTSTTSSFMLFGTPCMKRRKSSLTPKSVRGDAKIKRFSHTQRTYVRNSAAFLNPPSLTMKVSKVKKRGRDLLSWMENGEGVSEWVRSSSRYETTFFAEKEESRGWTQTVGE